MERSAACLTYDDWYVAGWFGARALFRQYNARATFFVARPKRLSEDNIRMLRMLQDDGHEIGCHTLDHVYLPKWIRAHSVQEYVNVQVLAAVRHQTARGFDVTSFAYPHYKYYPPITGCIMQHMRMVREAGVAENPIHALLPRRNNSVVNLMGVTDITGLALPISYIEARFDLIAQHGGAGVFCGHAISPDRAIDARQYCSLDDLERILAAARDRQIDLEPMRKIGHKAWMWETIERNLRAERDLTA